MDGAGDGTPDGKTGGVARSSAITEHGKFNDADETAGFQSRNHAADIPLRLHVWATRCDCQARILRLRSSGTNSTGGPIFAPFPDIVQLKSVNENPATGKHPRPRNPDLRIIDDGAGHGRTKDIRTVAEPGAIQSTATADGPALQQSPHGKTEAACAGWSGVVTIRHCSGTMWRVDPGQAQPETATNDLDKMNAAQALTGMACFQLGTGPARLSVQAIIDRRYGRLKPLNNRQPIDNHAHELYNV